MVLNVNSLSSTKFKVFKCTSQTQRRDTRMFVDLGRARGKQVYNASIPRASGLLYMQLRNKLLLGN